MNIYNENTEQTTKAKLPFDSENNIEGLCVKDKHNLLVALKEKGGLYGDKTPFKAIYRYNLVNNKTSLAYKVPKKKRLGFSGISYHPTKQKIFVLSHRTKELYQFDESSKSIDFVWRLNDKLFPQPEGICFSPDEKLYISNERSDKEYATILEF